MHDVGVEDAPCAEGSGIAWKDDAADADLVGRIAGMKTARAAEREQRDVATATVSCELFDSQIVLSGRRMKFRRSGN